MSKEVEQHVPGQVEIPSVTHESKAAHDAAAKKSIPAEGNNIASVKDRAFADTPPANDQPPVEKTFVSPPDAATKKTE